MIRRSFEGAYFHGLANHPDVRPFIGGGEDELPLAHFEALAGNPGNICIAAPHGGWILIQHLPTRYELHTMFTRAGRGRRYFEAAGEAMRYVFTATDAMQIITKCPDDNVGARWAAGRMGFREVFRREPAEGQGISYRAFDVDDWFIRDPEAQKAGQEFHAALEAAKDAAGSPLPVHPEDPAHDHAVGAAVLMGRAGHMAKGVGFYNRWALFAGYQTIELLAPNLIDVRDAIVEIKEGEMVVAHCR